MSIGCEKNLGRMRRDMKSSRPNLVAINWIRAKEKKMTDSAADILALAERLSEATRRGDNEEVARCYAPEARIWRNFDGHEQTIEEMFKVSRWINKKLTNRTYKVLRREAIPGGYVQQHVMTGTLANGDAF